MSIKNLESLKIAKATAEHDNLRVAIANVEHLLLVLKRMRDDPEGHHTNIASTDPAKILFGRWQAIVSDMYSITDALTEACKMSEGYRMAGFKFIFDTEDLSDMEIEGLIQ